MPPKRWYQCLFDRCGFLLHPGTVTIGCINANRNVPGVMNQYNKVDQMLLRDSGANFLLVNP